MTSLIRMGWGQGLPAFRRLFTTLFIPDASPEQMEWFDELQRVTADPATAERIRDARNHDDVTDAATRVACPTLVIHARDDALVPFAEGRLLATLIPGARFVALESRNHILLADEPAWTQFRAELRNFLGPAEVSTPADASRAEQPRARGPGARGRRAQQRGSRGAPVPQRQDGRAPPFEHLRQAARLREGRPRRRRGPLFRSREPP